MKNAGGKAKLLVARVPGNEQKLRSAGIFQTLFTKCAFASRPDLWTLEPRFLSVLCFHTLTNCFSRNPFLFTTIRIAPGCGGLCVLCAPTSVPSVLNPFLGGPNCRLRACRGMSKNCALHYTKEDFGL